MLLALCVDSSGLTSIVLQLGTCSLILDPYIYIFTLFWRIHSLSCTLFLLLLSPHYYPLEIYLFSYLLTPLHHRKFYFHISCHLSVGRGNIDKTSLVINFGSCLPLSHQIVIEMGHTSIHTQTHHQQGGNVVVAMRVIEMNEMGNGRVMQGKENPPPSHLQEPPLSSAHLSPHTPPSAEREREPTFRPKYFGIHVQSWLPICVNSWRFQLLNPSATLSVPHSRPSPHTYPSPPLSSYSISMHRHSSSLPTS